MASSTAPHGALAPGDAVGLWLYFAPATCDTTSTQSPSQSACTIPTRRSSIPPRWPSLPGAMHSTPRLRSAPMRGIWHTASHTSQLKRDAKRWTTPRGATWYGVCRALLPGHVYSHITVTWLDKLFDEVDKSDERPAPVRLCG